MLNPDDLSCNTARGEEVWKGKGVAYVNGFAVAAPRDNEWHGLFILSSPHPIHTADLQWYTHTHTLRYPDRLKLLAHIHKYTCFLLTSHIHCKLCVWYCLQETWARPIMQCFLSGSGHVSTNHKVNIAGSAALVHLLNLPIKAKLTVCFQWSRIYLSCSNWLIVAVLRWDWVVHHVSTEGCRRGRSCSQASKIAPHKV